MAFPPTVVAFGTRLLASPFLVGCGDYKYRVGLELTTPAERARSPKLNARPLVGGAERAGVMFMFVFTLVSLLVYLGLH
jgi:hypothetical protein